MQYAKYFYFINSYNMYGTVCAYLYALHIFFSYNKNFDKESVTHL